MYIRRKHPDFLEIFLSVKETLLSSLRRENTKAPRLRSSENVINERNGLSTLCNEAMQKRLRIHEPFTPIILRHPRSPEPIIFIREWKASFSYILEFARITFSIYSYCIMLYLIVIRYHCRYDYSNFNFRLRYRRSCDWSIRLGNESEEMPRVVDVARRKKIQVQEQQQHSSTTCRILRVIV